MLLARENSGLSESDLRPVDGGAIRVSESGSVVDNQDPFRAGFGCRLEDALSLGELRFCPGDNLRPGPRILVSAGRDLASDPLDDLRDADGLLASLG